MTVFTVLAFVAAFFAFVAFCGCMYFWFDKEIRTTTSSSSGPYFPIIWVGLLTFAAVANGITAVSFAKTSLDKLLFSLACMACTSGALILLGFFFDILKRKLFKLDQNSEENKS